MTFTEKRELTEKANKISDIVLKEVCNPEDLFNKKKDKKKEFLNDLWKLCNSSFNYAILAEKKQDEEDEGKTEYYLEEYLNNKIEFYSLFEEFIKKYSKEK